MYMRLHPLDEMLVMILRNKTSGIFVFFHPKSLKKDKHVGLLELANINIEHICVSINSKTTCTPAYRLPRAGNSTGISTNICSCLALFQTRGHTEYAKI